MTRLKLKKVRKSLTTLGMCVILATFVSGCSLLMPETRGLPKGMVIKKWPYMCNSEPDERLSAIHDKLLAATELMEAHAVELKVCRIGGVYQAMVMRNGGRIQMQITTTYLRFASDDLVLAILAHEYGHILKGHLWTLVDEKVTPEWKQYEADEIGMRLSANAGVDACVLRNAKFFSTERIKRIDESCAKIKGKYSVKDLLKIEWRNRNEARSSN